MVKCPRGTAEQVNANLEYLKSLHFRNFPSSNNETDDGTHHDSYVCFCRIHKN